MISILGSLLGFGTSFVPKLLKSMDDRAERKHQLELMKMQADLQAKGVALDIKKLQAEADVAEAKGIYEHDKSLDGGSFINAMRAAVRPVITYCFFGLFLAIKIAYLVTLLRSGNDWTVALPLLWDDETAALFAAIVSFWFGNRAVSKYYDKVKK
jgi:hypothetical protein